MVATKNRAGSLATSLLAVALLLTACAPPGPRAFVKGKQLLERGDFAAAVEEFRTASSLMPSNAVAWNYLGVALHQSGQVSNALFAYSQALRFDRELLEVRFNMGCLRLDAGEAEAAKADLFSYTSRRPNDGIAWTKLGTAQLQTREIGLAEKSFREALRVDSRDVIALNGLGMAAAQRVRWKDAAEFFAAALKLQPDFRPALLNSANALMQTGDRSGALTKYRAFLALQPRDSDWPAVDALVQALEPAKTNLSPSRPIVAAANSLSNPPQATNGVRGGGAPVRTAVLKPELPTNAPPSTIAKANPSQRTPTNLLTETSKTTSDSVTRAATPVPTIARPIATNAISAIAKAEVSGAAASSERRGFFSKLNPFRRSATAVEPASDLAANDRNVAAAGSPLRSGGAYGYLRPSVPDSGDRIAATRELVRGQEEQRAKRVAEAIRYFRQAAALDGSYYEAHYALGAALYEAREFTAAAATWERAIAVRPNAADARYNFALTLKAAGYYQEASDELEKLLSLHPDEARGHLLLGNLYAEQLGDVPRARKHYNRVLQLEPRHSQAQAIRNWLVNHPG